MAQKQPPPLDYPLHPYFYLYFTPTLSSELPNWEGAVPRIRERTISTIVRQNHHSLSPFLWFFKLSRSLSPAPPMLSAGWWGLYFMKLYIWSYFYSQFHLWVTFFPGSLFILTHPPLYSEAPSSSIPVVLHLHPAHLSLLPQPYLSSYSYPSPSSTQIFFPSHLLFILTLSSTTLPSKPVPASYPTVTIALLSPLHSHTCFLILTSVFCGALSIPRHAIISPHLEWFLLLL